MTRSVIMPIMSDFKTNEAKRMASKLQKLFEHPSSKILVKFFQDASMYNSVLERKINSVTDKCKTFCQKKPQLFNNTLYPFLCYQDSMKQLVLVINLKI